MGIGEVEGVGEGGGAGRRGCGFGVSRRDEVGGHVRGLATERE